MSSVQEPFPRAAKRPSAKLLIVEPIRRPKFARLGELPGVTVTGSVPDVRPDIFCSAAMVAPLNIARGTQNKILEAMAMGVLVVTSPMGAGGVDALDEEHFLVGKTPEEYADRALVSWRTPMRRERLARAGRQRMLTNHDWSASMQRLDGMLSGVSTPSMKARTRGGVGSPRSPRTIREIPSREQII